MLFPKDSAVIHGEAIHDLGNCGSQYVDILQFHFLHETSLVAIVCKFYTFGRYVQPMLILLWCNSSILCPRPFLSPCM